MRELRVKTNNYKLTNEHEELLNEWLEYIYNNMDVDYIDLFYYTDKLIMATVKLHNKDYAHFHITANRISFQGHMCTRDEFILFTSATKNDELYNGVL